MLLYTFFSFRCARVYLNTEETAFYIIVFISRAKFQTFAKLYVLALRAYVSNCSCKFNRWKLINHIYLMCVSVCAFYIAVFFFFKLKSILQMRKKAFLYTDWMVWMQFKRQLIKLIWKRQFMNGKKSVNENHLVTMRVRVRERESNDACMRVWKSG